MVDILVGDSIELWLLKLERAISNLLFAVGIIPDIAQCIFEFVRPCHATGYYLNSYDHTFDTVVVINGASYVLTMHLCCNNYGDYFGCSTVLHDDYYPWPHIDVDLSIKSCYHTWKYQITPIMLSDIFRCFGMLPVDIDSIAQGMLRDNESKISPDEVGRAHLIPEYKKFIRAFMDTLWFNPPKSEDVAIVVE